MSVPDYVEWIEKLGTGLGASIAALTAALTVRYVRKEHERAKIWRANELAAVWLEKLASDQELAFACHALDWGVGPYAYT